MLSFLAGFCGCGSPKPQPIAIARVEEPPPPPAPKAPPPPPPPPSPLEGADSNDVFDEAESLPNFEVTGHAPEVDARDLFAAVIPVAGADSSTFEVAQGGLGVIGQSANSGRLPSGFRPAPGTRSSTDGWPLRIVGDKDSAEMAYVPAGTIQLGHEGGSTETSPAVNIELSAYYVDVTEVTLERFAKFRGDVGAKVVAPLNDGQQGQQPALGIMWLDAREYAKWAGKDLPTEAEWELAARGANGWRTPWGNSKAIFSRTRVPGQIDSVAEFIHDRSPFGLFDVAGNAREWCADHYSPKAFSEATAIPPAKRKDWSGPKQPFRPNQRVVKGGAPDWSLWHRTGVGMRDREPDLGFRCVLRIRS